MHVDLPVTINSEYFDQVGQEINWGEDDDNKISIGEAEAIQHILTCEVSINVLHNTSGVDGSLVDDMVSIRRKFIKEYETKYRKEYIEYNEFYE